MSSSPSVVPSYEIGGLVARASEGSCKLIGKKTRGSIEHTLGEYDQKSL